LSCINICILHRRQPAQANGGRTLVPCDRYYRKWTVVQKIGRCFLKASLKYFNLIISSSIHFPLIMSFKESSQKLKSLSRKVTASPRQPQTLRAAAAFAALRINFDWERGVNIDRETTSRGLCGLVCPSRASESGTREEPGTLTLGAPVFPGSSRLGIEPMTPGWLVQDRTTSPSGIWSPS
jgi:hypothetical protein